MPGLRPAPDAVRIGRGRARLGPWSADPAVARLVASPDSPLDRAAVQAYAERARALGYRGMVTNALTDAEMPPYVACGFVVYEELHLLAAEVGVAPVAPGVTVTRVRRREHAAVLALDNAAFGRDWRLGRAGLDDALRATPIRQFRASRDRHDTITGYAITGVAGRHGYLQRIATDPTRRREGIGRALVLDALAYMWSHGTSCAYVNTQLHNGAALALYRSCGFEPLNSGLTVLECSW